MSDELVTLERNDDRVAVVTLHNGKVNALSNGVVRRLHEIAVTLGSARMVIRDFIGISIAWSTIRCR